MKNFFNKIGSWLVNTNDAIVTYLAVFAAGAGVVTLIPDVPVWILGGGAAVAGKLLNKVTLRV